MDVRRPPVLTWKSFPRFYWFFFISGLCRHTLLPLALLLLLGLVLGWVGDHLGLQHLVWHEEPVKQFFVGLAVGTLACRIFFLAYLTECRWVPPAKRFRFAGAGVSSGPLFCHLAGLSLSALLTLAAVVAGLVAERWVVAALWGGSPAGDELMQSLAELAPPVRTDTWFGVPLLVGGVSAALLFVTGLWLALAWPPLTADLSRAGRFLFDRLPEFFGVERPDEEDYTLHGAAFFWFWAALLWYLAIFMVRALFSPVVAVVFLLDTVLAVYLFAKFFLPRVLPVLVVGGVLLVALGGLPLFKQQFPGLDYTAPAKLERYGEREYATEAWQAGAGDRSGLLRTEHIDFSGREALPHYPAGQKRPLVIVCASGGGSRSAAWTLAMLHRLEERFAREQVDFPYHVRLVTGASGGMVGATYYVASLDPPGREKTSDGPGQYKNMTADFLSPVIHRMTYGDLALVWWPGATEGDRGRALEEAWCAKLGPRFRTSFAELREGERQGWRPSLIYSPMLIEDGRRLLVSNLDLGKVVQNQAASLRDPRETDGIDPSTLSFSAYEMFRLFPYQPTAANFRVCTAARMSASFPYVTPAVPIPTVPRRRVVDAGYFDNYGVSLAAAWLFSKSNQDWLKQHVSGVVLVQIRDGMDEQERLLIKPRRDASNPLARGLEGVTSPPEALFSSTTSTAGLRNDELLEVLNRLLTEEIERPHVRQMLEGLTPQQRELLGAGGKKLYAVRPRSLDLKGQGLRDQLADAAPAGDQADALADALVTCLDRASGAPFFTTVTFEYPSRASLSWYLTGQEANDIWAATREDPGIGHRLDLLVDWWHKRSRVGLLTPASSAERAVPAASATAIRAEQ